MAATKRRHICAVNGARPSTMRLVYDYTRRPRVDCAFHSIEKDSIPHNYSHHDLNSKARSKNALQAQPRLQKEDGRNQMNSGGIFTYAELRVLSCWLSFGAITT